MSVGIDRIGTRRQAAAAPAKTAQADAAALDFDAMLQPATGAAASAAVAQTALADLTFVQEDADVLAARQARDRRARRHGRTMLDALGVVQREILGGDPARARAALQDLVAATQGIAADDPVLRLVLRDIAVRAAVEIARGEAGAI